MRIVSSAIKFQIIGSEYYHILCGKRHSDILHLMKSLGITYDKKTAQSGFMTDRNKFVNREIARIIAYNAGQIINRSCPSSDRILFSEDIW